MGAVLMYGPASGTTHVIVERQHSYANDILLAAWAADAVIQNKIRAEQFCVEEDVVRRGRAAWQVCVATGTALPDQLQLIAEAQHVVSIWTSREAARIRSTGNAWRATGVVIAVLSALAVPASGWWILAAPAGWVLWQYGAAVLNRGPAAPDPLLTWNPRPVVDATPQPPATHPARQFSLVHHCHCRKTGDSNPCRCTP